MLKIKDLHELRILTFVRKCINKETIPLFHDYFTHRQNAHSHNTRNDQDLSLVQSRTEAGVKRIRSVGVKYWNNNLFARSQLKVTLDTFKHNLKNNYLATY